MPHLPTDTFTYLCQQRWTSQTSLPTAAFSLPLYVHTCICTCSPLHTHAHTHTYTHMNTPCFPSCWEVTGCSVQRLAWACLPDGAVALQLLISGHGTARPLGPHVSAFQVQVLGSQDDA